MPDIDLQNAICQFNVGIVVSRYNYDITQVLAEGAQARLKELNFRDEQITTVWVPGAVEIPLVARRLARTKTVEAIICLGAVIKNETRHFEYVCDQVSQGCQRVAFEEDLPVIFYVLTTENHSQAQERAGGKQGHVGIEGANAAVEMVSILRRLINA